MKVMLAAFVVTALITVGAWYGLGQAGFSSGDRQAGGAVRLD
ncbi:MAG: hypothetical protein RIE24_27430 [Silicimonas sp.]